MVEALSNSVAGLQNASLKAAKAADNIANPNSKSEPVEDIVAMKEAEQSFKANATVLGVSKDMQEDLYRSVDIEV